MSTSRSTDSQNNIILFGDKRPDALPLSQLYDPDKDVSDISSSGKLVPAVGSLVIDDVNDNTYDTLYWVSAISANYKCTLRPIRYVLTDESDDPTQSAILTYGSSRFVLFYDDRVKPTKLEIDGKLYILGTQKVEYRLLRTNRAGEEEIISQYIGADERYDGNRIPLTNVVAGNGTIKICTNCHTLFPLVDGEIVTLQIFNANGQQTEEYNLITKRSIIQDDLASDGNPIVAFDADATQMINDEFYLYENQSPTALNISPYVTYADGNTQIFAIDNVSCFMYGFDRDNIPSYPGRRFKILIKKFLSTRQTTSIDSFDKTNRSVSVEKWVNIVKNGTQYSMKLSVIPWYDSANYKYQLKFFAYTEEKEHVYDVTDYIDINDEFDPSLYNREQYLKAQFNTDNIFQNGINTIYQQSWWITLREPGAYETYILKDTKNDEYAYGVESSTVRRPVIHYDTTLQQYFIPTSVFANQEAFLECFYRFARPPYNTATDLAPTIPTHFTIRAIDDANVLITTPIPVEQYNQVWNIVRSGSAAQLVGGVVLVEFLNLVGTEYKILYGVPVQVYESRTGYNTETNNITP